MTDHDRRNAEAARRLYQREMDVLSPDIVWHVPGHNPVSGTYHGLKEYAEIMTGRMAPLDRRDFDVNHVMVNGEYVVATVHFVGDRRGKHIDMNGAHILRVRDGKIIEGWGFASDQNALDDFFSA